MKLRTKILASLLMLSNSFTYGQTTEYNYKRELNGISRQWHKIIFPNEVFRKISPDFSDIRIFGITPDNDTVEAPYLLRLTTGKITDDEVAFKMINASQNDAGYYFTFEIPKIKPINQIQLNFSQENFDWRINLEGSQNQRNWFSITENYRILSIKNKTTDFQFTRLIFPASKYRYFRLLIKTGKKPGLNAASIGLHEEKAGTLTKHIVKEFHLNENNVNKQTEIEIQLKKPVPVSYLKIDVNDTFDFYRPVTIKYVTDSIKTDNGWYYNYNTLSSGILNSFEKNEFKFNTTILQRLKIDIYNQDNQPLNIDTIQVKGHEYYLLARFTKPANYFLFYGNKNAVSPQYDIGRFTDKIPVKLTAVNLGKELKIVKKNHQAADPIFKNRIWLWIIMMALILLLGWFSVKMIRRN